MSLKTALSSSFKRIYPKSSIGGSKKIRLEAALNERMSFQLAMRHGGDSPIQVQVEGDQSKEFDVRIRRIGYVPVPHFNTPVLGTEIDREGMGNIPGYVPDPLFEEEKISLPPHETHGFWITLTPNSSVKPGRWPIILKVIGEDGPAQILRAEVDLFPKKLKKRKGFPITHWFYVDSLLDWYGLDGFGEPFWKILSPYLKNISQHGQDVLYVPLFTPPLDGPRRPSQLLRVTKSEGGKFKFDWKDVRRFISMAKKCGIRHFEWTHLFSQWGAEYAIEIFHGQGETKKALWSKNTKATSNTYQKFLSQFLPEFYLFLEKEKLLTTSFFHVSDEPHGEQHLKNYRAARRMLQDLAPWMKVMDAMSQTEFADIMDFPVPMIQEVEKFQKEGIESWCYYCCYPRGEWLNRLMDTPLAKIAMHGLLFYKLPVRGFLHWGYNYWCKAKSDQLIDPFIVSDGGDWPDWAYGDTFVVYPGPEGPIDSIRWEVFSESLQDYQLLQSCGISPDDPMLKKLKSFKDFPKTEAWRKKLRRRLLSP